MPRLAMFAMALSAALLPPYSLKATFDAEGISEPVDKDTFLASIESGFTAATGIEDDLPEEGSPFFNPTPLPVADETGAVPDLGADEAEARRKGKPGYLEIEVKLANTETLLAGKDAVIDQVNAETLLVKDELEKLENSLLGVLGISEPDDILKSVATLVDNAGKVTESPAPTTPEVDPLALILDDGLKARLVEIKGVGDSTAEMVLGVIREYAAANTKPAGGV